MSEMKVTFELSEADRGLLTEILTELKNARPNCERCVKQMADAVEHCTTTPAPEHPVDAVPPATAEDVKYIDQTPEEHKTAPAKTYTAADVQSAVTKLCASQPGKKSQIRDLVKQYAPLVSKIPEDKYTEFMEKLEAL